MPALLNHPVSRAHHIHVYWSTVYWAMDSNPDSVRKPGGPFTRSSQFMGTPWGAEIHQNLLKYIKIQKKYTKLYRNIPTDNEKTCFCSNTNRPKMLLKTLKNVFAKRGGIAPVRYPRTKSFSTKNVFWAPWGAHMGPILIFNPVARFKF